MNETGLVDPQELGIKDAVQDEDTVIAVDADAQTGEVTATTGDETAVVDGGEGSTDATGTENVQAEIGDENKSDPSKEVVYQSPEEDPVVLEIQAEIIRQTNIDFNEAKNNSTIPNETPDAVWNRVYKRISANLYDDFVANYPQKAKAYASVHLGIQRALLRQTESEQSVLDVSQPQTEAEFITELEAAAQTLEAQEKVLENLFQQLQNAGEDKAVFDQFSDTFDASYQQALDTLDELKAGLNQHETDAVFAAADSVLEVVQRLESLRKDKDLLFLRNSELADLLASNNPENRDAALQKLVEDGIFDSDQVENTKKRLTQIEEFAGVTFDTFSKMNEGSSLDTFLAFLLDPVNSVGRDGERFKFGTKEIGDIEADIMPLPTFRTLFKDAQGVGRALYESAESINYDWAVANREALNSVRESADPSLVKQLLTDMYSKLLVNSENRETNIELFRMHFATELLGEGDTQYMDDNSFTFFREHMLNGGEKLDDLWDISSSA